MFHSSPNRPLRECEANHEYRQCNAEHAYITAASRDNFLQWKNFRLPHREVKSQKQEPR